MGHKISLVGLWFVSYSSKMFDATLYPVIFSHKGHYPIESFQSVKPPFCIIYFNVGR